MRNIVKILITCIVAIILINSLVFVYMAIDKTVHAYILLFQSGIHERPGIHLGESLDGFMLAIFFIIFAVGILNYFCHPPIFSISMTCPG
jgi:NADH:ubiquinone oxidoreductase subunit 3 (subunit A)